VISLADDIYAEAYPSQEAVEQRIVEIAITLRDNYYPASGLDEYSVDHMVAVALQIWYIAHNVVDVKIDEDSIAEQVRDRCNADTYWNQL